MIILKSYIIYDITYLVLTRYCIVLTCIHDCRWKGTTRGIIMGSWVWCSSRTHTPCLVCARSLPIWSSCRPWSLCSARGCWNVFHCWTIIVARLGSGTCEYLRPSCRENIHAWLILITFGDGTLNCCWTIVWILHHAPGLWKLRTLNVMQSLYLFYSYIIRLNSEDVHLYNFCKVRVHRKRFLPEHALTNYISAKVMIQSIYGFS